MLKHRKGTTLSGQRAHTMSKPWSWEADYSVVAMCMSETNLSRILLCQAAANKGWKIQIKLLHQMVLELQSRLQRVPALEQDDSRELCHRLRIRNYVFFFFKDHIFNHSLFQLDYFWIYLQSSRFTSTEYYNSLYDGFKY